MSHLRDETETHQHTVLKEDLKKVEIETREKSIRARTIKAAGDDNWVGYGFDINPQVTLFSVAVLISFIVLTLMFKENTAEFFKAMLSVITQTSGWFLILVSNIFIIAAAYFALGKFGQITLGGVDAKTEFSTASWYAMLLSAGMGIGLMFWSVGEPMFHYLTPSPMFVGVAGATPEAAKAAMGVTYFHWGLHPWAIYAVVGLGLAFFSYNRGLPLTIRSMFYPLLGDRIYGFWGNLIDVLSVLATLLGLATSLGLGVMQINAGLQYLFGIEVSVMTQIVLIAIITGIATISVMVGLEGGVKRLSQANMLLACFFMVFLLVVGPTLFILSGLTQNLGYYLQILPELSLWTETFRDSNWQGGWTIFYWAWWISWSPFVGMFIARISKGRTVREFVFGVMFVPTLISFIWMSVFGGAALHLQASGIADIAQAVNTDVATAMFVVLDNFPFSAISSFIAVILVTIFFVTSSDSGSLVVDNLTSGGKLDSPASQRVFWALLEGTIAAVLLIGGGLITLQAAAISTGLPFAIVLLLGVYSQYIGFSEELAAEKSVRIAVNKYKDEYLLQRAVANAMDSEKG